MWLPITLWQGRLVPSGLAKKTDAALGGSKGLGSRREMASSSGNLGSELMAGILVSGTNCSVGRGTDLPTLGRMAAVTVAEAVAAQLCSATPRDAWVKGTEKARDGLSCSVCQDVRETFPRWLVHLQRVCR